MTDAARLRELLRWMKVPEERIGRLDFVWLAENLSRFQRHPHYAEARMLLVRLLEADENGKSKRLR